MKAILIGATGAVGRDLLEQLLSDPDFSQIVVLARRKTGAVSSKLTEHIIDFDKPEQWAELVCGDVLFSALGTTLRQAGGQKNQWKVDYDYQLAVAKAAAANGVQRYVLVSSIGASVKSANFYLRMKGALEEAVSSLAFCQITIIRPQSLIRKNSDRIAESISVVILKAVCRLGIFAKLKPIRTEAVAACMVKAAKTEHPGVEIIEGTEIPDVA